MFISTHNTLNYSIEISHASKVTLQVRFDDISLNCTLLFIHHICHFWSTDKILGLVFVPHKNAQIETKLILRKNREKHNKIAQVKQILSHGAMTNYFLFQMSLLPMTKLLQRTSNFVLWCKIASQQEKENCSL